MVRHSRQVFCGGGWLLFVDGIDIVAAAHSGLGTDSVCSSLCPVDLAEEGSVGQRLPACQMIAITLRIFSESLTLLTAILLAKGWTVVRRKISAKVKIVQ